MLAHQIIKRIVWYIVLIVSHRCSRGILRAGQAVTVISDCFPSQCPLSKFFANLQISIQRWTNSVLKTMYLWSLSKYGDICLVFFYQLNMKNIWLNDRKRILLSRRVKKTLTKCIKHWVWKTLLENIGRLIWHWFLCVLLLLLLLPLPSTLCSVTAQQTPQCRIRHQRAWTLDSSFWNNPCKSDR